MHDVSLSAMCGQGRGRGSLREAQAVAIQHLSWSLRVVQEKQRLCGLQVLQGAVIAAPFLVR